MRDGTERQRLLILKMLQQADQPLAGRTITRELCSAGHQASERTVRYHLLALDKVGLTELVSRKGRKITHKGRLELSKARIIERVGYLAPKIDQMTYLMNFDLAAREGRVVVNVSLVDRADFERNHPLMMRAFEAGYSMGRLITLYGPGERVGDLQVPGGFVGVGTVCSITLNGVLLAHGIPTFSRFGGLLEIQDHAPTRFVAVINYDGTSLDPLEIFIKSGMTDHRGAVEHGNGLIGASFRETPAASRERVLEVADRMKEVGLGGILQVGWPSQPLLEIPVGENRVGMIVIGGLNPSAILAEAGVEVHSRALSGLADFRRFFEYTELPARLDRLSM